MWHWFDAAKTSTSPFRCTTPMAWCCCHYEVKTEPERRWLKVSSLNQGGKFWLLKGTTKLSAESLLVGWVETTIHLRKTHHAILNGNGNLSTSWNWVNVFSPQEKHSWIHLVTLGLQYMLQEFLQEFSPHLWLFSIYLPHESSGTTKKSSLDPGFALQQIH